MRRLLVLLAICCLYVPAQAQTAQRVAVGSSLTVQVSDRDATAASLIRKAEALGGYFSVVTNEALTLKVPTDKAAELIAYAKENWKPVEESYRSEEVLGSMDQLRARLKAKQELLDRFDKLLASADARDIVEVESAATRLIHEIEVLKGQLQALQHRLDYATVVLNFRLLERQRPRDEGRSPFAWLNGLGLDALLGEFEQ